MLEDCDLIAEERGGDTNIALFETLEAMDGLDGDANVTFILTTKEAVRRCVLAAAQQDREPRDEDLERALDEMLSDAETFTRTLLGGGDLTLSMPPEEDEELVP